MLTSNNAENNARPWGIKGECNVPNAPPALVVFFISRHPPGPTPPTASLTIDSLSRIFSSEAPLPNLISSRIISLSHSSPREHKIKMLNNGAVAVAIVRRRVMIVQAARTHTKCDKYLDVQTYSPFGERIFLASEVPGARIATSDILSVFDASSNPENTPGMLELPPQAFSEYLAYSERQQKQYEDMWCAWTAKH